ncbi:MAG TPA: M67 family metallopeptidase [Rhizomicrobium sp.]
MSGLILPRDARARIEAAARTAWPRECCGLIEGMRVGGTIVVTAAHPARNVAEGPDVFEIDPAEHIRLLRALRDTGRQIVGCFHSHPNGVAEPSACDRQSAGETGFVWLIAALTASDTAAIKAFVFDGNAFLPVAITQTASLDPVRRPRV